MNLKENNYCEISGCKSDEIKTYEAAIWECRWIDYEKFKMEQDEIAEERGAFNIKITFKTMTEKINMCDKCAKRAKIMPIIRTFLIGQKKVVIIGQPYIQQFIYCAALEGYLPFYNDDFKEYLKLYNN